MRTAQDVEAKMGQFLRRRAAAKTPAWFAKQLDKALKTLEDAATVADARIGDGSLADSHSEIADAVKAIRGPISKELDKHHRACQKIK